MKNRIRIPKRTSKMKRKIRIPNVKKHHIAIHSTGTRQDMLIKELDKLPYHFLIIRSGRLISIKPVAPGDRTIEIAWIGGLDKHGRHVDNRTEEQNDTLFNVLVVLTERYADAKIVGADELYVYGYANPGFNIKSWLRSYIPAFLQAA
jgi:hypothetical protein